MPDPEVPCRFKDVLCIVDKERPFLFKFQFFLGPAPELNILLRIADVKGAKDLIKIFSYLRLVEFYLYRLKVGVSKKKYFFSPSLHYFQKIDNMRMDLDKMAYLFFQGGDVEVQLIRPEINIAPVQCPLMRLIRAEQMLFCSAEGHIMLLRIFFRNEMPPEIIVKIKVQQCAVHIKEDIFDFIKRYLVQHCNSLKRLVMMKIIVTFFSGSSALRKMKRLLVTGSSGFLGWNICNLVKKEWCIYGTVFSHPVAVDGVNILRIDLTDFKETKKMFSEIRPDAVIHTAAAASPNYCQTYKEESHRINVDASIHLAGLCADLDIPFVFVSTDLVFNGLNAPYREEDPVAPVNMYAEQKVLAEEGILKRYPKAAVCRTALMYGFGSPVSGSFLQPLLTAMRDGKDVRLFVDEFRNPLSAQAAVQGIFIALKKVKGVLHLGGRERVSRYDFGRLTAEIFGIPGAKLIPCLQKDLAMAAPRAPDVTLDCSKAYALGFSPQTLREEITRLASCIKVK